MGRVKCPCQLACLLLLVFALPAGCPAPEETIDDTTQETVGTEAGDPVIELPEVDANDPQLLLLAEAEDVVEAEYPAAMLVEARGTPANGTATDADDIVDWLFIFTAYDDDPGSATVLLEYTGGEFGEPELVTQGLIGTMFDRLPRTMTLTTAVQFMRDADYDEAFSEVILRKPLTFPIPEETFYIFETASKFVFVGMATGEVGAE